MTSKFVLVHSPEGIEQAKRSLEPPTLPTLESTTLRFDALVDAGTKRKARRPSARKRGSKTAPHVSVGIWSLGAWLGALDSLIASLNKAQTSFVFYEIEATVPSGLISRPERMVAWLTDIFGPHPDRDAKRQIENAKEEIKDNLIANDFFGLAEGVRSDFGLDYIIGITPSMVAGNSDSEYYWNHFSTFEGKSVLASSYDLHAFAKSGQVAFNALLIQIIASQLLVAMFWPKLGFHDNRNCWFDYDAERAGLIDKVRNPNIEPDCLAKIETPYRESAQALVEFVRDYRSDTP
jgi:hypothetical protein